MLFSRFSVQFLRRPRQQAGSLRYGSLPIGTFNFGSSTCPLDNRILVLQEPRETNSKNLTAGNFRPPANDKYNQNVKG